MKIQPNANVNEQRHTQQTKCTQNRTKTRIELNEKPNKLNIGYCLSSFDSFCIWISLISCCYSSYLVLFWSKIGVTAVESQLSVQASALVNYGRIFFVIFFSRFFGFFFFVFNFVVSIFVYASFFHSSNHTKCKSTYRRYDVCVCDCSVANEISPCMLPTHSLFSFFFSIL